MNGKEQNKTKKVRMSVSLAEEAYQDVERIAERKKVSIAWVVRDAVDQYLAAEMPLFRSGD